MRIELRSPARIAGFLAVALTAIGGPTPSAAAPVQVDRETRVRSIGFDGERALPERELRETIRTRDRGAAYGLRAALGRLPLVPSPTAPYFSAIELQRDVVRLREHYAAAGYLYAEVRYDVKLDEQQNLLDIRFRIDEGRPTHAVEVTVTGVDSLVAALPGRDRRGWEALVRSVRALEGDRLEFSRLESRRGRLERWWQDHGHPAAAVRARVRPDSLRAEGHVRFEIVPGAAARFGEITVEGNRALSEASIRRELPFRSGDPYSASEIAEGRSELQQLEIVRLASFDLLVPSADSALVKAPDADSLPALEPTEAIPLRVRIIEAKPRFVSGEAGYVSDAGLSTEARWSHRNFTGGGRNLTVSAAAQTGLLAITEDPDERYRGTVSLLQPYVFDRRMSAVLAPYVEHRDDRDDRTLEVGSHATLVFRAGAQRSAALDYRIARRRIYEYRVGGLASGRTDLLTLLVYDAQGILDSLGTTLRTSLLTLSGNLGALDQPSDPRRGFVFRPAVQVTAPPGFSSTRYWTLDGTAHAFLPLGRMAVLAGRVGMSRLFPFGRSVPGPGTDGLIEFLQLRDVLFTAGGSGDVRGWATEMLGPKFPDLRLRQVGDSVFIGADGYVPTGGLARTVFSLELRLPFPGLGPQFGTHVFLDGGRVWNPDRRFDVADEALGQERTFYATGAGIDLLTPVGPIRFSMGYKLNPSITDLVDSGEVLRALAEGTDLDALPRRNSRRWQVHFSIGTSF